MHFELIIIVLFTHFFLIFFFFFNDTATTEIYTLSLHDALPICSWFHHGSHAKCREPIIGAGARNRSEEHTSELQSRVDLVCRLLLEKKKQNKKSYLHVKKKKNKKLVNLIYNLLYIFIMYILFSCFNSLYIDLVCHFFFFFFNDTATTEIYTLSLHDALPI